MKNLRRSRCLVALQMSDQMPRPRQICHSTALPFPFLHPVLPKMPYPCRKSLSNRLRGMHFRYRNQGNFLRPPPRLPRSIRNPLTDLRHIFPNPFRTHRKNPTTRHTGFLSWRRTFRSDLSPASRAAPHSGASNQHCEAHRKKEGSANTIMTSALFL
jgi:hypothetical protein